MKIEIMLLYFFINILLFISSFLIILLIHIHKKIYEINCVK